MERTRKISYLYFKILQVDLPLGYYSFRRITSVFKLHIFIFYISDRVGENFIGLFSYRKFVGVYTCPVREFIVRRYMPGNLYISSNTLGLKHSKTPDLKSFCHRLINSVILNEDSDSAKFRSRSSRSSKFCQREFE